MGELKIEVENKKAKILGEKRYYIGEKVKISGLHSREKSKNAIENEEAIKIKRMYGIGSAMEGGKWEQVGGFIDTTMDMKAHAKSMIPIPEYMDEIKGEING